MDGSHGYRNCHPLCWRWSEHASHRTGQSRDPNPINTFFLSVSNDTLAPNTAFKKIGRIASNFAYLLPIHPKLRQTKDGILKNRDEFALLNCSIWKFKDRIMPFDIQRARQETPGCAHVLHFNNAGSSLMPQPVLDATIAHLQLEAQIGGYEAKEQASDQIEHTYDAAATLIGCERDEIAIIENATRAWDMAFYSIPFKKGDRILTSMAEYASNYISYLQIAQKTGAVVEPIPDDQHGQLSLDALQNAIDDRVRLISVTHIPTSGGLVNPVAGIGRIARAAGILYLVDACQSVGQMPMDVRQIG